jgi:hypothetical protein
MYDIGLDIANIVISAVEKISKLHMMFPMFERRFMLMVLSPVIGLLINEYVTSPPSLHIQLKIAPPQ